MQTFYIPFLLPKKGLQIFPKFIKFITKNASNFYYFCRVPHL